MGFLISSPVSILNYKRAARAASVANVALSGGATLTIDGVSLSNLDRVLLKNQTLPAENGIYEITGLGTAYALARSSDANSSSSFKINMAVAISEGTVNADKVFQINSDATIILGTTAITFSAIEPPAASLVPAQATHGEKVLATDGSASYWAIEGVKTGYPAGTVVLGRAAPASFSPATNTILIGKTASTLFGESVVIGEGATSGTVNNVVIGHLANGGMGYGVLIGKGAATGGAANYGVGIGMNVVTNGQAVSIGYAASVGTDAVAIGYQATSANEAITMGRNANSVVQGLAIGRGSNCAGLRGIVVGYGAYTGSGPECIVIGNGAGTSAGTGDGNTIVGRQAGTAIGSARTATIMGWQTTVAAGSEGGTAIGCLASTSGIGTALGYYANGAHYGVAIGTGSTNTAEQYGVAVGASARSYSESTAVGYRANQDSYGSRYSVAVGAQTQTGTLTNGYNISVGYGSGKAACVGDFNSFLGAFTNSSGTAGARNLCLGAYAGRYNVDSDAFYVNNQNRTDTAGDKAKSLMYGTFNATASSQTLALNAVVTTPYTLKVNTILIHQGAGNINTPSYNANIGIGFGTLENTSGNTHANVAIGYEAFKSVNGSSPGGSCGVAIGYSAGRSVQNSIASVCIGNAAAYSLTSGHYVTAIGKQSLYLATTGDQNVALGSCAGYRTTTQGNELWIDNQDRGSYANQQTKSLLYGVFNATAASQTLAINAAVSTPYTIAAGGAITGFNLSGTNTGDNAATSLVPSQTSQADKVLVTDGSASSWQYAGLGSGGFGTGNVFLGTPKPAGLSGATNSVYIGVNCGDSLTTGFNNTAIGNESLRYNLTGASNCALGRYTLQNTTGSYNTAIGGGALKTNTSGANNSALGFSALYNNVTGTGNVAIGYYAGRYATASDEFYLNNQNRTDTNGDKASSLMYGQFNATASSQTLAINADLKMLTYTESVIASGVVGATQTISILSGTVQTATLTASALTTFTMPTATAGKSFTLYLKQDATTGLGTATFTGVKWATAGAPVITATAGQMDILSFVADGTNWYGSYQQGYTP